MIDTKVKVNGKTVAEYDLINEPYVKKVNGESPDDKGNVEVEVASDFELPEGVPYKKSYVVKRSEYTGEEITSGKWSYVSPLTPTVDELSANGLVIYEGVTDGTTTYRVSVFREGTDSYRDHNYLIAVAFADNAVLDNGTVLPKAGIYFYNDDIPGYGTREMSWSVINKLPSDLLPVDYAVINSSTSGSSKKFKLTVDDSGTISATEITE